VFLCFPWIHPIKVGSWILWGQSPKLQGYYNSSLAENFTFRKGLKTYVLPGPTNHFCYTRYIAIFMPQQESSRFYLIIIVKTVEQAFYSFPRTPLGRAINFHLRIYIFT